MNIPGRTGAQCQQFHQSLGKGGKRGGGKAAAAAAESPKAMETDDAAENEAPAAAADARPPVMSPAKRTPVQKAETPVSESRCGDRLRSVRPYAR
jgi:hypothetical protein